MNQKMSELRVQRARLQERIAAQRCVFLDLRGAGKMSLREQRAFAFQYRLNQGVQRHIFNLFQNFLIF